MEQLSDNEFKQMRRANLSWLEEQSFDLKLELIRHHLSLCQIYVNEFMEQEVIGKAGARYSRNKPHEGRYSRWGYNQGSVRIGDQKVPVDVPRVMDNIEGRNIPLESYDQIKQSDEPTEQLLQGVLRGLSTRDYDKVINYLEQGFGLSKSEVSRRFVERTKMRLEEFEGRRFDQHTFVAIFIDGKYLAKDQIIIVLGVTDQGDKIPLGFIHAPSEHSGPVMELFRNLKDRGLKYDKGILFVVDGSKGFRKAIVQVFGAKAVIQRCVWHKRENLLKYLPEDEHDAVKRDMRNAFEQPSYEDAKIALLELAERLGPINISAARSLQEGLEEILTLHRLGIYHIFGRSFSTTNCIENLNSQLGKYLRKVKSWKNSEQKHRWIASGLIEIEQSMRKVPRYRKLNELQKAIILETQSKSNL